MLNSQQQFPATRDFDVFARRGWLAEVPASFRAQILARCDVQSVSPGDAIYHVGDESVSLCGVAEGQIGVHAAPHGDSATLMHLVGPGFWTGEFAAATHQVRIIGLLARTPARVLRLPRSAFQRIAEADPQAWRHLALMAARNLGRAVAIINALRRDNATERLAATLANLAAEVGETPAVIRVSQDDLGALARLSRGSVNSALARLEAAGLVRRDYGAITLHDRQSLGEYIDRA